VQLYEHQAKTILERYGIDLPRRRWAASLEAVARAAHELGPEVVLKAQVPAGGRGKAGGIRFAAGAAEAARVAAELLGSQVRGFPVRSLLIEERLDIAAEYYLGFTVDARSRRAVCLVNESGGIDVEAGAGASMQRAEIDPYLGLQSYQALDLATLAQVDRPLLPEFVNISRNLYRAFTDYGALLLEVNPLVVTRDRRLVAADARMNLDNNALDRREDVRQLIERNPEDFPNEHRKMTDAFDHIILDPEGEVGLVSSGAGLTMATIDQIHAAGLKVFNFCDVRTGQLKGNPHKLIVVLEQLATARRLKVIMVPIFAGSTDLSEFADTLLKALREFGRPLPPVVVRCVGTNEAEGIRKLREAGFFVTRDLDEAVSEVVRIGGDSHVYSAR